MNVKILQKFLYTNKYYQATVQIMMVLLYPGSTCKFRVKIFI